MRFHLFSLDVVIYVPHKLVTLSEI